MTAKRPNDHTMLKLRSIILATVLAAAPSVQGAEGDSLPPRQVSAEDLKLAEQHFATAVAAFERGNWLVANVEFSAAYKLTDKYQLLYNLSLTAERQGQLSVAIEYAQAYARTAQACSRSTPPTCEPIPQNEADEAEGRLGRLKAQLRDGQHVPDIALRSNQDATLAAPAPHTISKPAQNAMAAEHDVRVPTTQRHLTELEAKRRAGALALVGVGGGLLIVGIGCGVGALLTQNTINGGGAYFTNDYRALIDRGNTLNGASIAFDVVGAAMLASGTTWAIVERIRHAKDR